MKTFVLLFASVVFLTIYIHPQATINIPADYPTIQEGINAATNGDIVLVADGTYYENINFKGKAITVASHFLTDGNKLHIENTIIDGSQPSHTDSGSVVMFNSLEDSTSLLCGFTITEGTGTKFGSFREGGGIRIDQSSPVIRNNIIEFNEVIGTDDVWGGAIFAFPPFGANLIIEDNIVRNNFVQTTGSASNSAGIIYISGITQGTTKLRNNYIYDNVVTGDYNLFGGGIFVYGNNQPGFICYIENNKIIGNEVIDSPGSSTQWGGGIYLESVKATVRNNIIAYNSAEDGGGIYYYNNLMPPPVTPIIENNTIFGNTATGYAGALTTNRELDIKNCIIWGNSPQFYGAVATIEYSTLEENYPTGSNNSYDNPQFLDTSNFFLSNTSPCTDGGNPDPMYNDVEDLSNPGNPLPPAMGTLRNDMGVYGGPHSTWGMMLSDTLNVPTDYSTIQEAIDAANNGDFVLVADGTYYENINYKGKAITVASHFLVDEDSTHIENTIIDGSTPSHSDSGSVVYFTSGEDTTSILRGFTITGGTGTYSGAPFDDVSGGGIFIYPSGAKICNNIIEYNSVSYTYAHGGGILGDLGSTKSIIIENNIIRNNTTNGNTSTQGGGIALFNCAYVSVLNNKIMDNTVNGSTNAWAGGITCNGPSDEIFIIGNYIKGNVVNSIAYGGGLDLYNCTAVVKNNLIVENSALSGGGVYLDLAASTSSKSGLNTGRLSIQNDEDKSTQYNSSEILLASSFENNTIVNNTATNFGGGIFVDGAIPQLMNSILWGNTAVYGPQIYGTADVQYSDVEGGYTGIGNIDQNPQFIPGSEFYLLGSGSPCIDMGNPDSQYNDVEDSQNPGSALWPARGTLINDMGCFGGPNSLWSTWGIPVSVKNSETENGIPSEFTLSQNYPNPFNPTTTIKYGILERAVVELKVYDILGREVVSLINEEQEAGYHEINFNASKLSSGVYLYQLKADSFIETKKMILLK